MISALVIDDNPHMADSLCQLLNLLEVSAFPVYGPRAALTVISEKKPDIVFLDVNMPGLSGFEVLVYLRREPELGHIPVVVVTSDDQEETERRARQEGAMKLIVKPVGFDDLECALREARLL